MNIDEVEFMLFEKMIRSEFIGPPSRCSESDGFYDFHFKTEFLKNGVT